MRTVPEVITNGKDWMWHTICATEQTKMYNEACASALKKLDMHDSLAIRHMKYFLSGKDVKISNLGETSAEQLLMRIGILLAGKSDREIERMMAERNRGRD